MIIPNSRNADSLSDAGGKPILPSDETQQVSGSTIAPPELGRNVGTFKLTVVRVEPFYLTFAGKAGSVTVPCRHPLLSVEVRCLTPNVQSIQLKGAIVGATRWISVFSLN